MPKIFAGCFQEVKYMYSFITRVYSSQLESSIYGMHVFFYKKKIDLSWCVLTWINQTQTHLADEGKKYFSEGAVLVLQAPLTNWK